MAETNIDELRAEMKRAVRYRSGSDLMNTVYLGGLATAGIMHCLGTSSTQACRDGKSLGDLIDAASDGQIEEAWEYQGFQWILKHYRKAGSKLYRYETTAIEID